MEVIRGRRFGVPIDEFQVERAEGEPAFTVDLDGFEGPLDLLLELARRQKVDLARISVLALAEQYLTFVEEARKLRLELAADYLVMAAWLAYLKSRLLLPAPAEGRRAATRPILPTRSPSGFAGSSRSAAPAKRCSPVRSSAATSSPAARRRRSPAPARSSTRRRSTTCSSAYARRPRSTRAPSVRFEARVVWSLAEAREALTRLIGRASDWTELDSWLIDYGVEPKLRRTARASSFSASLELVREGQIELRQDEAFAPLWVRPVAAVGLARRDDFS